MSRQRCGSSFWSRDTQPETYLVFWSKSGMFSGRSKQSLAHAELQDHPIRDIGAMYNHKMVVVMSTLQESSAHL